MTTRGGRIRGWFLRVGGALAAAALWPAAIANAQNSALEMSIKATYLVKFASFVAWPATAFATASSPLTVCVAGPDPFGSTLDRAAAGQSVAGHPVETRRIAARAAATGCHILFVGDTSPQETAVILNDAPKPVLTVTGLPASAPRKGMINFVIDEKHVRFEIDNRAATESGLRISSQLLAVAVGARPGQ